MQKHNYWFKKGPEILQMTFKFYLWLQNGYQLYGFKKTKNKHTQKSKNQKTQKAQSLKSVKLPCLTQSNVLQIGYLMFLIISTHYSFLKDRYLIPSV